MNDHRQEKRAESWKREARRLYDEKTSKTEQHWVDVNEQLPDPSQWVVLFRATMEDELNSMQTPFDIKQGWVVNDEYLRKTHRITHWLEIPEPPHLDIFGS